MRILRWVKLHSAKLHLLRWVGHRIRGNLATQFRVAAATAEECVRFATELDERLHERRKWIGELQEGGHLLSRKPDASRYVMVGDISKR